MFDKILEAQKKAEEIKQRLDSISVSGEVESGKIRVTATASKRVTDVFLGTDFIRAANTEEISELLVTAINKALDQAENISQAEMQAATRDMVGGLGGLFGK